jgi:hypothetical protein
MFLRPHPRLRLATAFATLGFLIATADLRAASKINIASIGDRAPGGGQFLGPSLTSTPSAAGNGWIVFRTLVTSGGTSEQIVAKNMIPGAVNANASTFVVAEIGKSAGKDNDQDLGSFKQFLGRPAINANGDVVFVATLSNSDRLPADITLETPAGVFLYRRAVPGRDATLKAVALARDVVPGIGTIDFGNTIDILSGSLTAIDVPERTPAINDAGDVAFTSVITTPRGFGGAIFLAPQGFNATPVVRIGDVTDGGEFTVLGPPALNNAGTIAFRGLLNDIVDGVFQYSQGITTPLVTTGRVVITTEPFPFAQLLFDFGEEVALNDRGDVAFTAGPLFDGTLESTDLDGAPGVFVFHDGTLSTVGYPGRPVVGRGRITDVTLGPDGGNDVAPPTLSQDGRLIFFGELNSGRQQALFRVDPPYNSIVLTSWITLGGSDPTTSPIQGTYQAAASAPVIDAAGNVTFFARIAGAVTSEALLFLRPDGGAQYVLVGQATPTKGLFGGPPFSGIVLTDAGDVYFKSFVAAGPSGLGLFHWHPSGNGKGDTSLVVRTGDAAPLEGAPRFIDLVGDASVNANGDVAFAALVGDGVGRAVFASSGGVIRPIALPNQDIPSPPAPPAAGFRSIAAAPMMLADGSVVFRGTYDYPDPLLPFSFVVEDGVFVSDPSGGLRLLAHSGESSPVGMPFFRFRDTSVSTGGSIAFRSSLGDEFDLEPPLGLFVIDPSATIRAIAVAGQTIGNGPHVSTLSGRPAIDAAGNVAFLGEVVTDRVGTALVRSAADGTVSVLAQVGGDGPRGGTVKSLSRPTMASNGHLAYRASFEAGSGGTAGFFLTTDSGTIPFVVIGESDADGEGGRFSSLNPGASLNASDQLAFVGSSNQGKTRNGIFLASPSTMTAQALSGRIQPLSLKDEEPKPRDTLRGRVTLETSGLANGFDLSKDAVSIAVSDKETTYFNATVAPNKLARQGNSGVLRRRQAKLKKLRIRAKRGTVHVSFAAGGLDLLLIRPPLTIRLSVGNDGGVVTVPCDDDGEHVVCHPS